MCQKCGYKVEDAFLKHDGLQGRLDMMASQLSDICNLLTVARERLEKTHGCSSASPLQLQSLPLLWFPVSSMGSIS